MNADVERPLTLTSEELTDALAIDLGQTHDHEIGLHDRFEAVLRGQAEALIARGWTLRSLPVGDDAPSLDVERLYRAMVSLDSEDPGVFNIIGISEPDTRPVATALAAEYARLAPR